MFLLACCLLLYLLFSLKSLTVLMTPNGSVFTDRLHCFPMSFSSFGSYLRPLQVDVLLTFTVGWFWLSSLGDVIISIPIRFCLFFYSMARQPTHEIVYPKYAQHIHLQLLVVLSTVRGTKVSKNWLKVA